MKHSVSRRFVIGAALSSLAGMARAGAPMISLRPRARPQAGTKPRAAEAAALIAQAKLGGKVGFSVINTATGQVLEGREAHTGMPPASVAKTLTALYALRTLGPEYRFGTRLMATGVVQNGVLQGDLVLAGGGDPTLDTDALADMATRLKKAGVREVRGRFRVWGGALPFSREIDSTQPNQVSYNPAVSGLSLNYNRVHFEWKRQGGDYKVTMDARSARYRPDVQVARMSIANRKSPVYTYRDNGASDIWTVARGALGKGGARWLPVRKPERYAGEVFAIFARSHGIVLGKPEILRSRPGGTVLVTHQSAPLRDVLRDMLKYSTNLTAEMVGMAATARRMGKPLALKASAREMSDWAQRELGMTGARLVDHSGLGGSSRLTAEALARVLTQARGEGLLKPILKKIILRHKNGTPDKAHPIHVVAKTGTLYFVSALAGYMTTPDGTELTFAILSGDTDRRAKIDHSQDGRPAGSKGWNRRAKRLQQKLIERWAAVYGS